MKKRKTEKYRSTETFQVAVIMVIVILGMIGTPIAIAAIVLKICGFQPTFEGALGLVIFIVLWGMVFFCK